MADLNLGTAITALPWQKKLTLGDANVTAGVTLPSGKDVVIEFYPVATAGKLTFSPPADGAALDTAEFSPLPANVWTPEVFAQSRRTGFSRISRFGLASETGAQVVYMRIRDASPPGGR